MNSQTKNDDDEPPFVLQNCSAMSRQAAMSTAKPKQNRGWGFGGWFGGVTNSEESNKNEIKASEEKDQKKMETSQKLDKSSLSTTASTVSSPSVKSKGRTSKSSKGKNRKKGGKKETAKDSPSPGSKVDKSLLPTNLPSPSSSSVSHPTTPVKSQLNPSSPMPLSPPYPSPDLTTSTFGEKSTSQQSSITETATNSDANGISNGGISPDELSRQKRREEIRQKTAWYEEYIRDHLAKNGGSLSSLNKEELVALGLFDKQRRLNRRMRLWGRSESEAEQGLADEELEQLFILAEECNQAQNDEAELEMLLVQMENNEEVDMDRLYHLELLSRQRLGEILNQEELDALQIFEGKKQDKEDLDSLRRRQKDGTQDIDETRLRELTLLERKRSGDESMTNAELRSAEIIEMRDEDVRLNKNDYSKLLRLKEQGIHVDEDRFNLLSLLDRRRNGEEMTESEEEILEHYFALREEEYAERFKSKMIAETESRCNKTIIDEEQVAETLLAIHEGEILGEKEEQPANKLASKDEDQSVDDKEEDSSATTNEENREEKYQNWPHETESTLQQQDEANRIIHESIGDMKLDDRLKNSEDMKQNGGSRSTSTFDNAGLSLSENAALEDFQSELEKQGLPLAISFIPYCEDDEFDMSAVSFSDATYINDILLQKESRESDRKEECLEDAYYIYKRTIKKQKLPESEEMLLRIFTKILEQRNKEMRDEDIKFDQLVERAEALYELRKQEKEIEVTEKQIMNYMDGGQRGSEMPTSEEAAKPKASLDSENGKRIITQTEVEEKSNIEVSADSPIRVEEDNQRKSQNLQQSTLQRLDMAPYRRSANNSVDSDEVSQDEQSKTTDDESRFSNESTQTENNPFEQIPDLIEREEPIGVTQGEPGRSVNSREENKTGRIDMTGRIDVFPSGDRRNEGVLKGEKKDILQLKAWKDEDSSENCESRSVLDANDGESNGSDGLPATGNKIAESIEESPVGKAVKYYLQSNKVDVDEFHNNAAKGTIPFETLGFEEDGESNGSRELPPKENKVAESIEESPVGQAVKYYLRSNQVGTEEFHENVTKATIPFESLPFEEMSDEEVTKEEETVILKAISQVGSESKKETDANPSLCPGTARASDDSLSTAKITVERGNLMGIHDAVVVQDTKTRELLPVQKTVLVDVYNEMQSNSHGRQDEQISQQERGNPLRLETGDLPRPVIDGEEIEPNLLYELDLVIRLRKGIHLTEKQDYELDLLRAVRQGVTLSEVELEDFELLRSEREQVMLNDAYLRDLDFRSSRNQQVNDDLIYEIELFHKVLSGEHMSDDEQIELYHFERRLNGDVLKEDDLEELEFLKSERLSRLSIDQRSNGTKELIISEESSGQPIYHAYVRKIERSSSEASSEFMIDPQTSGKRERSLDDEDSIYRRDLLGRQMAGQRLDKKEFEWLQILMKKSRNEELDETELDELEIMRNQRNEKEVDFVNTKKLLEKELERQNKNRIKEQRRKEKEERREQRRKEKQEREKLKKIRRRRKSIIRSETGAVYNAQAVGDEKIDAINSHDAKTEVQIIGAPSLQPPRPEDDKKEEPKMGVFGAVFKNAKKQRQEQQLEEAKRLQEELIREQMKALALENEAEELEREKVMQEQLVQETIEKKRAASVVGSSFASSVGSTSWDTSSAEMSSDESDESSWTSWDTSSDEDSNQSANTDNIQQNEKENGKEVDYGTSDDSAELSKIITNEVESQLSDVDINAIDSTQVPSPVKKEPVHVDTGDEIDQIPPNHPDGFQEERVSNHSTDSGKAESSGERRSRSDIRGTSRRRSSLGAHLKKKKKKRTKHGDDVSLGTMQLTKVSKDGRKSPNYLDKESKSKDRPWIVNDPIDSTIDKNYPETAHESNEDNRNDKSMSESSSFDFNPSFISRISERDDEDEGKEEESLSFVQSGTDEEKDADTEAKDSGLESLIESLANSFTSIGEEAYDLGLEEYDNIESRLGGKVKDKQAEFDLTWETAVADENVIIQINQRLRERQRKLEVKREKKKEKKERKSLKEVPRLFLFEGERVLKNGSKKKNTKKVQNRLNRTLTREFRKAMKEVFDSDSDSDDGYQREMNGNRRTVNDEMKNNDDFVVPPFSQTMQYTDDDASEPSVYSDNDKAFAEESPNNSDDESVKFDGEYLKRLQARSLPTDLKKMLSGRSMTSSRNFKSSRSNFNKLHISDDNTFTSDIEKGLRRPRRKKTGEIVNPNVDPAEVYAQELVKQNEEKTFTIAGVRKDMEDMKRSKDFIDEGNKKFADFDAISPSPLVHKPILKKPKKKKRISLGKGVESLERQRPKLAAMRSMRSLGTTTSDQGLLTGNRRRLKNPTALATPTIEEDDRDNEGDATRRLSSDSFEVNDSENEKPETTGGNSMLPNKLFGAIKKTFKTKKPIHSENPFGGGLLNGVQNEEFDTSESKGGITDESYGNPSAFAQQEPLPLPEEEIESKHQRANKMLEKVKIKGVIKKLKKLPGISSHNRKFGGGIMMAD